MSTSFAGRRALWSLTAVFTAVTSISSPVAAAQGNLGFLKDAPVSRFKAEDFDLMKAAAAEVLESTDGRAARSWQNAATGNGGSIHALSSFTATDGRACKRLRVQNNAKGIEGSSTLNVCRSPEGKWQLDPNVNP